MLLSSRIVTLQASASDAAAAAVKIHEAANSAVDLDVNLFAGVAGYPTNTFIYSVVAEGFGQLMEQGMKLNASDAYNAAAGEMTSMLAAPVAQNLRAIVAMAPQEPFDMPLGSMFTLLMGSAQPGKGAEVRAFGAEAVAYMNSNTGRPAAFLANAAGGVSDMGWLVYHETPADIDEMFAWSMADSGYQDLEKRSSDLFLPASFSRTMMARIA